MVDLAVGELWGDSLTTTRDTHINVLYGKSLQKDHMVGTHVLDVTRHRYIADLAYMLLYITLILFGFVCCFCYVSSL